MSTPSVEIVEQRAHLEIIEHQAAVVELEPQGDLAIATSRAEVAVETGGTVVLEVGIAGPQGRPGEATESAFTHVHHQPIASASWLVIHGLAGYPNVTVVDSSGAVVEGDVTYLDADSVQLDFQGAFAGDAYLS